MGLIKHYTILPQHTQLDFVDYTNRTKTISHSLAQKLLPTSAFAIAHTQNDFFVNLLDKPNSKDGKVIARLFSHKISLPTLKCPSNLSEFACDEYIYKAKEKHYKAQKNYYNANKQKLINPLWCDDYLVLIWDILPSDWCKVWILKAPDFDEANYESKGISVLKEYKDNFNNSPSTLKLYEGYIHSSGLEYLCPFGENYVKR